MTPYQFGVKMAIKTAAAPQAMNMNAQPQPLTTGQRVEEHMRRVNQPAQPPRAAPPKKQTPVLPPMNTSMLMGNNPPQYSQQPESMGNMPVDDLTIEPPDVTRPSPSALNSLPTNKQLMSKVPRSPFNLAKTTPAPAPKPPTTDVAKF
jgi:hypothetical protein